MNEKTWWYVARAGGITAWVLVAAVTLFGLVLSTRIAKGKVTPAWLLDLHRHLGGLSIAFTAVHVAGLVADSYVTFGFVDVVVPFASEWKPGPVAAGVVAMHLLVAVEVTSLLQRKIPRRWWRRIHGLSMPLFLLSTMHTLTAGTDGESPAMRIAAIAALLAFMFLIAYRAAIAISPTRGRPGVGAASPDDRTTRRPASPVETAGGSPRPT
jgi:DMSO/TMAO reductase YedYZ heme-binding membrane subunit